MMKLKTPYFQRHLTWLLLLGIDIDPVQNIRYKYLYKLYSASLIGFLITYGILEMVDLGVTTDFNTLTFGLCYNVTHLLGMGKIIMFVIKKSKLRVMLNKLESGYFVPNVARGGQEEIRLVNAAVNRCIRHAQAFNYAVNVIITIRCLYALFDTGYNEEIFDKDLNTTIFVHKRTLPYTIWLPLDTNKSPTFEIVFFCQAFSLIVYGYYIGVIDSMVYGLMIHMNTQYLILGRVLQNYVSLAKNLVLKNGESSKSQFVGYLPEGYEIVELLEEPLQQKIKEIIHGCARHHTDILDFCDETEALFSYLMLSQFLCSLYILCFQLYQLSLMETILSFDFISMCFYLMLMMYQLFCYCWYGNEILIRSEQFSEDLYHSDWLALNNSTKKSLLLMMMRAQRPIQFTAGKFALLSLPTFMTIVRGSASYFMVLKQMSS